MKLKTIIKRIPIWYAAGKGVHLRSSPGRGKSTTIERAPEILAKAFPGKKFGIVIVNAQTLTPADLIGFGVPKHHDGWSEMIFTEPPQFRTSEGKRLCDYDGGIIFIDEIDKGDADVKKICGEGQLSGRFGPHQTSSGWVVWTAGNLATDRSGSTKEYDHLINRRMEINVTDDLDSLLEYGAETGVSPVTLAWINDNPAIVFQPGVPEKQGPWPTPRSVFGLDSHIQTAAQFNGGVLPDDDEIQEEAAGMIGQAAVASYFAHVKLDKNMPKFESIIADPKGAPVPAAPDARMLICYKLAHKVDKSTISAVIEYVKRMPDSFAITFGKVATTRDPRLTFDPTMLGWVTSNNVLMTALNALPAAK